MEANKYSEQSHRFLTAVRDSKDLEATLASYGDKAWAAREAQRVLDDTSMTDSLAAKFRRVQKLALAACVAVRQSVA